VAPCNPSLDHWQFLTNETGELLVREMFIRTWNEPPQHPLDPCIHRHLPADRRQLYRSLPYNESRPLLADSEGEADVLVAKAMGAHLKALAVLRLQSRQCEFHPF
jgi:hypothetical protein